MLLLRPEKEATGLDSHVRTSLSRRAVRETCDSDSRTAALGAPDRAAHPTGACLHGVFGASALLAPNAVAEVLACPAETLPACPACRATSKRRRRQTPSLKTETAGRNRTETPHGVLRWEQLILQAVMNLGSDLLDPCGARGRKNHERRKIKRIQEGTPSRDP